MPLMPATAWVTRTCTPRLVNQNCSGSPASLDPQGSTCTRESGSPTTAFASAAYEAQCAAG
eukprot:scaffold488_cov372-Prasinococcus_capsulatus_cf.AAC.12